MIDLKVGNGRVPMSIDGDENRVIYLNLNDPNFFVRAKKAEQEINRIIESIKDAESETETMDELEIAERIIDNLEDFDNQVRTQVNYMFDENVSDVVFGRTSSLATVGNEVYAERFMNAVMPHIEKAIKNKNKQLQQKVSQYTAKYKKK